MKIKLKASKEEHRAIAKMFVGCRLVHNEEIYLVNAYNTCFVCTDEDSELGVIHEITIDTSKSKPDLRLAIGTDIRFEMDGKEVIIYSLCPNENELKTCLVWDEYSIGEFKYSATLSKSYLESIGVEIEE